MDQVWTGPKKLWVKILNGIAVVPICVDRRLL